MGFVGKIIGPLFFIMVLFAALTSSVSLMETVVAGIMHKFNLSRKKVSFAIFIIFLAASVVICLGYNIFYFELMLPTSDSPGQLLDVLDYISNYLIMPVISILTCILIGWIKKPSWAIEEMEVSGYKFKKKMLYSVVIRYLSPVIMTVLLIKALGIF